MKKLLACLTAAFLLLALAACDQAPPAETETAPATENEAEPAAPEYIWTVSIDETQSKTYNEGQLTANYTVHLSASMEGGESPLGEYNGEIRVEYEGIPDEATLFAINLLQGSYDFEGWGENDAISFPMVSYDHAALMDFVSKAYQGAGARVAPLIEGIAMYAAEDIPWSQSDWEMGLDAGLDGVFGIDAQGDETGGSANVYTPFGNSSAGDSSTVPLRCSLHFIDESRAQFNIWSHGNLDVDLSFNGTLDKVPLSDTIQAE